MNSGKKGLNSQRSNSGKDHLFGSKKVSVKQTRNNELDNKTASRGMLQINSNDIVYSKTMNLSQILTTTSQGISNSNANGQNVISNSGPKHPKTSREYNSNNYQSDHIVKREKRLGTTNNS